jgi:hypothetical protein
MSSLNIVVIHGKIAYLVKEIIAFLRTLGLTVNTIEELGSNGQNQHDKVLDYIKKADLSIVIATFDSKIADHVRPNVIHELTLSHSLGKKTILLQEKRSNRIANIGSNLTGIITTIQFQRGQVHKLFHALVAELVVLGLETGADQKSKEPYVGRLESFLNSFEEHQELLRDFMPRMDAIWKVFDEIDVYIAYQEYTAKQAYADHLDNYFVLYWNVFDAISQHKLTTAETKVHIATAIKDGKREACLALAVLFEAKMSNFSNLLKTKNRDLDLRGIETAMKDAQQLVKRMKPLSDDEKIINYKKALDIFVDCQIYKNPTK